MRSRITIAAVSIAITLGAISAAAQSVPEMMRKCAETPVTKRMFHEYGSVYAGAGKVLLPSNCGFRSEAEVQKFQKKAGVAKALVDDIQVQLQPKALAAFIAARREAARSGLEITLRGRDASRRSYQDTLALWRGQVDDGLRHWTAKKKLTPAEAARLRKLPVDRQVIAILELEEDQGLNFGNGYRKSILQSVAAPGYTQHIMMLALDIKQHDKPKVREILARHGWFQTVRNDTPHFTYLGASESQLPALGLRRDFVAGRTVWVPAKSSRAAAGGKNERTFIPDGRFTLPTAEIPATASLGVLLPYSMRDLLGELARDYHARANRPLHITSGYRTPDGQARAMHNNFSRLGVPRGLKPYRYSAPARAIAEAYADNKHNPKKAIREMTETIAGQIKNNVYVSRHLRKSAFDVRMNGKGAANFSILRSVTRRMGGSALVEDNHYHVQFPVPVRGDAKRKAKVLTAKTAVR